MKFFILSTCSRKFFTSSLQWHVQIVFVVVVGGGGGGGGAGGDGGGE